MKKTLIASLAALSVLSITCGNAPVIAASTAESKGAVTDTAKTAVALLTDLRGHWAESSVIKAIKEGIVSGYPDGRFYPDHLVSRAEFIKMTATGVQLPVSAGGQPDPWYHPYLVAAKSSGMYKEGDFASADWTQAMTRMELAHVAVRAIGETGKEADEFMYIATKKGLISGTGNGSLDPDGTTTRAQAVTVIQRIQQVRNGQTLPVDELAVANAEAAMSVKKDAWRRAIRTTNLPENAMDYPYILEKYPNEMYEMAAPPLADKMPAVLAQTNKFYKHKPTMDAWKENTEAFYRLLLNVDYRTISEQWAEELFGYHNQSNTYVLTQMKEYVAWVKKNNIVIDGTLEAEPSMVFRSDRIGLYYIRTKFTFKLESFEAYKNIVFDEYFMQQDKFQKGQVYEGYADIALSTNVGGSDLRQIDGEASLFKPASIIRKIE